MKEQGEFGRFVRARKTKLAGHQTNKRKGTALKSGWPGLKLGGFLTNHWGGQLREGGTHFRRVEREVEKNKKKKTGGSKLRRNVVGDLLSRLRNQETPGRGRTRTIGLDRG